jgi:5-methylcytosine-specific restriction endonuclease McrA
MLSRTHLSRAIALIMKGDAVVEEADPDIRLRHRTGEMPLPRVIRLLRYVKVPIKYGPKVWTKAGVLERDEWKCAYCKKRGKNIVTTVDHVLPQSRGGRDTWENTVASCTGCNFKKADRTPEEANMTLLTQPWAPMRIFISAKSKPRR